MDEAQGDTGKAIVLLIQTPSLSPQEMNSDDDENNNGPSTPKITQSRNKKTFMQQHLRHNTKCGLFWYYISIIFWILMSFLFIGSIVMSSINPNKIIEDSSFIMTICFCSGIELIFTFLILYGIIQFEIWAMWVTCIWSSLHGITIIYAVVNWGDGDIMFLYISIVLFYWIAVIVFNIMYFHIVLFIFILCSFLYKFHNNWCILM